MNCTENRDDTEYQIWKHYVDEMFADKLASGGVFEAGRDLVIPAVPHSFAMSHKGIKII